MTVAPVAVSVQDVTGQWIRLPHMPGVQFSTSAPGGPTEATIPLGDTTLLPDLQQGCAVRITDGTTGEALWTGRLSSPVRQVRGVLESGDPSFEGQAGYLGDRFIRYTPLVTRLDAWKQYSNMKPVVGGSTVSTTSLPTRESINALVLSLPSGYMVSGYCSLASFHGFYDSTSGTSMTSAPWPSASSYDVRSMVFRHVEGAASGNRSKFQVYLWHGNPSGQVSWSSSAIGTSQQVTHVFDPDNTADVTLGFQYNGPAVNTNDTAPAVTSDELWAGFWEVQVYRSLRNLWGERLVIDPSPVGGLYPHQIAEDLLGHFLYTDIDRDYWASTFDESSDVIITSYDFADFATPADILTDLMELAPTHFWTTGVAKTTGEFPVHWLAWDATPTLLLPPGAVTYDEAASASDLCSRLQFTYTDSRTGEEDTDIISASFWAYPDLVNAPNDLEAPQLDLTGLSSYSAALQVAKSVLGQAARMPKSATATVSVPVAEQDSGVMLPPWKLTAGCMAHVPETGETLRVTKVDVDVDTATATLTLGTPRRSVDQIVSTMYKHRKRSS